MEDKFNVGFLWLETPGYLLNCLGNLTKKVKRVVLLYTNGNLPKDIINIYSNLIKEEKLILIDATDMSAKEVYETLKFNEVIAVVVCGWHHRKWMRASQRYSGVKILTFDNQWNGNTRQLLGTFYGKLVLSRKFDGAFVPGSRSKIFAEKMGFLNFRVLEGLYVGNDSLFSPDFAGIKSDFLFSGRLVLEKNIKSLLDGYKVYREKVNEPWNLKIAGQGPLEAILTEYEGVNYLGQLSQSELSLEMKNSRFLVLPSLKERWGVVIQESVLSGTPVICSAYCGSADYFVRDNESGYIINSVDSISISECLIKAHHQTTQEFREMCDKSIQLAYQFTPETWAKSLLELIKMSLTKKVASSFKKTSKPFNDMFLT